MQGGVRGRDQGDIAAQVEKTQRQRAWAHTDPEEREDVIHRHAVARSDAKPSPLPTGETQAPQRLATTAFIATTAAAAAPAETPTWSRSPDVTKHSLPSDSDLDSETADSQVAAFAVRDKRRVTFAQPEKHSSELH
ncbi:hypothetical protein HGM15179_018892 [Zosterops borbonicus]|uniref:Uncharacterized protein n=1 Tax=Zosterops borbonicus TaxID=364589 RepID=A0A8K1FYD3_9PASS|nr:hypothetical protein HGM15179_018892 [Zosterops borbonicus]